MMTNEEKQATEMVEKYIAAWNHRATDVLKYMFHRDIFLTDWDISVQGADSVVGANAQIWESVPDIKIEILETFYHNRTQTLVAKLAVSSKMEDINLPVIDIIKFKDGKIFSVDAYKQ